jgi:MATE family multidrug resistance protein
VAETIVNIFLDYSLIYGRFGFPAIGFNGAAYASIIAEGSGLLVIFVVIHFNGINKAFSLFESWKIDFETIRRILYKSSPLVLQFAISIITWEYFYILIEHHGNRALAISNTMRNIFGIFGAFVWAFAATANTMVSNVIGQGKSEEVLPLIRRIVILSLSCSAVLTLLLNLGPEFFLSFYGQDQSFITEAIPVIRIVSIALLMMSFSAVWLNAVTGTGNTMINLVIELITIVVYAVYVYLTLETWNLPITWGWGSELVYWACMFSMSFWYMKSERWVEKRVMS